MHAPAAPPAMRPTLDDDDCVVICVAAGVLQGPQVKATPVLLLFPSQYHIADGGMSPGYLYPGSAICDTTHIVTDREIT